MEAFFHYLTLPFLLEGCLIVVALMVLSLLGGLVVGLGLALASDSKRWWLRYPVRAYIYIIRGTPQLLQLILLFNVLPQAGIYLSAFTSALLALTINETAFCAEIIRGGIGSVDRDQRMAAEAFGFSRGTELFVIVLPQALRAIIPTLGNEAVGLLKSTSLASVVGVNELTLRSQTIVSQNFEFLPVLVASGTMYIVMSTVLAWGQQYMEQRFSLAEKARRGAVRPLPKAGAGLPAETPPLDVPAPRAADLQTAGTLLAFEGIHIGYRGVEVIKGVDLRIRAGEVVALLGRSGSGKSTLLKSVLALTTPTAGRILVAGKPIGSAGTGRPLPYRKLVQARAAARIGMVFQNFALFGHLTALENAMSIPRWVQRLASNEAAHRGRVALIKVGLAGFADRLPHELSGGQQQRVGIARALAGDPQLLLFDEPTSALDPELVGEVNQTIRSLAHTGITMLLSTHDIGFAASVADRIVFLDGGRIAEEGGPDILARPATPALASFLRHMPAEEGRGEPEVALPVSIGQSAGAER
ncbi:amino acid ABC transporter permease/ATP-binding protein [Labrys monachus]|uniref:Polar amino acid transport system permease protein n=1 Tax=Labrys monachus TaxID=217067 RepID=A0ABU0FIL8_9HYPH|nr:amino acid ABC transporter permease/ATP-binding protein [Labrys monachus]MDQ0394430.1 polar amino acid transport system permease protein [Labrys monachus]